MFGWCLCQSDRQANIYTYIHNTHTNPSKQTHTNTHTDMRKQAHIWVSGHHGLQTSYKSGHSLQMYISGHKRQMSYKGSKLSDVEQGIPAYGVIIASKRWTRGHHSLRMSYKGSLPSLVIASKYRTSLIILHKGVIASKCRTRDPFCSWS